IDRQPHQACVARVDPRSPRGHTPPRGGGPLLRGDHPSPGLSEGHGDEPAPLRPSPAPVAAAGAPVTCADVERLVDAFADAELPAPTMLAVARHAAGC